LRFDCFDQRPHYHYDPEDKNLHLIWTKPPREMRWDGR
jgi:hypothetical protein